MNKNKFIIFFLTTVVVFTNWRCSAELFDDCLSGEGVKETQVIDLQKISAFDISGAVDLTIIEATDQQIIEITSFPNLIDKLIEDSFVDNEVWRVGLDGCIGIQKNELQIRATIDALKGISITGSGDVRTEGGSFENVEDLILNVSGSGDMDLDLGNEIGNISTVISGSGDFSIGGKAQEQNIIISGSGDVKAFDLETKISDINISGSGNCEVHATETLNVKISGSGDVCYIGTPVVDSSISGSGRVRDCN